MIDFLTFILIILGYLLGSISWSIIISRLFFKTDIRKHGSGNPGGANMLRTFGFLPGIIVILLDSFKALLIMTIVNFIDVESIVFVGFAAIIGHCYPIYYQFKGGKAVSTTYGFLLGLCIFCKLDVIFTLVYPLLMFLFMLFLFKMMSLSSMTSLFFENIILLKTCDNKTIKLLVTLATILVFVRHKSNILRIIEGKENKVNFIK